MSGRIVRRPHRDMVLTPETTVSVHFKVSVRCGKCRVPRELAPAQARFDRVRDVDWVTIFERVRFRCRCGSLADALKVERHTRDRPEEVLYVQVQTEDGCGLTG